MQLSRRAFSLGLATGVGALAVPAYGAGFAPLEARPGMAAIGPEGAPRTAVWAYGGSVPGPVIRLRQGDRVQRRFVNGLPQPSSVHWHGIRIANAMDGVAGLTQDAVSPDLSFDYDFVVPDAGTYWYHPHNRTFEQLARGLYGALIVEEAGGGPDVDADEVLLIDDWRITRNGQIADGFGSMHDRAHAGRIGNWVTVNGRPEWRFSAGTNERMRLRLLNVANARVFRLGVRGLEGWVVALDGMPLAMPLPLDEVVLGPSQRADVLVDVVARDGAPAQLVSHERDGIYVIGEISTDGSERQARRPEPAALPANPVTDLGALETARRFDLKMEGGAMGRLQAAEMDGKTTPIRDMAAQGMAWALAGVAGMPEAPFVAAQRGETIRVRMVNDTRWPHAMHLHGHHFRVLQTAGPGPWRDTVLMAPGETVEIAFVADNPGDWLLHCHMLEHAASGMMTWMRVA